MLPIKLLILSRGIGIFYYTQERLHIKLMQYLISPSFVHFIIEKEKGYCAFYIIGHVPSGQVQ